MTRAVPLDEFKRLAEAALGLAVAGLASDPEWVSREIVGRRLEFTVPFESCHEASVTASIWPCGALKNLLTALCERSNVVAPRERDDFVWSDEDFAGVSVHAPREMSAHEILSATTLLAGALADMGVDQGEISELLALR